MMSHPKLICSPNSYSIYVLSALFNTVVLNDLVHMVRLYLHDRYPYWSSLVDLEKKFSLLHFFFLHFYTFFFLFFYFFFTLFFFFFFCTFFYHKNVRLNDIDYISSAHNNISIVRSPHNSSHIQNTLILNYYDVSKKGMVLTMSLDFEIEKVSSSAYHYY